MYNRQRYNTRLYNKSVRVIFINLSEALGLSDEDRAAATAVRTESLAFTDVIARLLEMGVISETMTLSDAIKRASIKVLANTVSLADLTLLVAASKPLSDSMTIADARVVGASIVLPAEQVALLDVISKSPDNRLSDAVRIIEWFSIHKVNTPWNTVSPSSGTWAQGSSNVGSWSPQGSNSGTWQDSSTNKGQWSN